MTPMINPDLKGYSDEAASTVVDEKTDSIFCAKGGGAKRRRNLLDVEYVTLTGHKIRTLLEEPEESFVFQRLWEEMRGTYVCGDDNDEKEN